MDRLGAGGPGDLEDAVGLEVAFAGWGRADGDRLVAGEHMAGAGIGVGVDGNRLNAHAPRRPDDAAGDLAPVGDQDLGEHQASSAARAAWCRSAEDSSKQQKITWVMPGVRGRVSATVVTAMVAASSGG